MCAIPKELNLTIILITNTKNNQNEKKNKAKFSEMAGIFVVIILSFIMVYAHAGLTMLAFLIN